MNKAEEKLYEFIDKNITKEKDKFACGSKNNYYDWQELKDELTSSRKKAAEDNELLELYKVFIKDMSLTAEFRKWSDKTAHSKIEKPQIINYGANPTNIVNNDFMSVNIKIKE